MKQNLFILLVTLSTTGFAADYFYDGAGILSTVEEEIESIRQGDLIHAYSTLTTQKFKDNTCFNDFLLFISEIPALYNNVGLRLGLTQMGEQAGVYEGEIFAKEGENMAIHFQLKKGQKRWLIDSIIVYPLEVKEMPGKKEVTTLKDRFLKFFGFK